MSFDFSSIFFILIAIMTLQPLLMGRWYAMRRAQAIRAIEKKHDTRVITMIHRQEKRSLLAFRFLGTSTWRMPDSHCGDQGIVTKRPSILLSTRPAALCWPRCRLPAPSKHTRQK